MARPSAAALPETSLERGITQLGSAQGLNHLFSTLHSGEPIVIGVIGASVAQNAGCLDQPHKRCMLYSGNQPTHMTHGWPRYRPFKGFAVRLYDHIQSRFPHHLHQINNSGLDATPMQLVLPCLFSHMPMRLHLVILDFGSMATHLELSAVEGVVRALLSLQPRPALLLISFREWCTQHVTPRALYQVGQLLEGSSTRDNIYPDTPWSRTETETQRVCTLYGQGCISVHRALEPHVYAGEAGFGLLDVVGKDCLHPMHGRFGVDYVTQMVNHWFDEANASWSRIRQKVPRLLTKPCSTFSGTCRGGIPPPLHDSNRDRGSRPMRCFGFKLKGNMVGQTLHPLAWCSSPNTYGLQRKLPHSVGGCWEGIEPQCPILEGRAGSKQNMSVARAQAQAVLHKFTANPPRHWFYCRFSLGSAAHKISPGVVGLLPGATLLVHLDIAMAPPVSKGRLRPQLPPEELDAAGARPVMLRLEYLVSFEHMGTVRLTCAVGCACTRQRIDAHQLGEVRNVSVFAVHSFAVTPQNATIARNRGQGLAHECELQLRILNRTSSGEHKFKVRSITVGTGTYGHPWIGQGK